MASIKLGAIASDIRGSIGGTVFSRNGGGAYAKQRVKPTDPSTAAQQTMRSIISSMIAAWAALTSTVRTDWANYAAAVTLVNRLGDAINVSGYNMYCRSRAMIERLGMSMPAAAPTTLTLAEQDSTVVVTADASAKEASIVFNNALGWAGEVGGVLVVAQSRPQNATVNSFKGPYKIFGTIAGAVVPPVSPQVLPMLYTMAAGQKVFCQFRVLRADGRLSEPFRTVSTVVA